MFFNRPPNTGRNPGVSETGLVGFAPCNGVSGLPGGKAAAFGRRNQRGRALKTRLAFFNAFFLFYTQPCAFMASATFRKPAMLAPAM